MTPVGGAPGGRGMCKIGGADTGTSGSAETAAGVSAEAVEEEDAATPLPKPPAADAARAADTLSRRRSGTRPPKVKLPVACPSPAGGGASTLAGKKPLKAPLGGLASSSPLACRRTLHAAFRCSCSRSLRSRMASYRFTRSEKSANVSSATPGWALRAPKRAVLPAGELARLAVGRLVVLPPMLASPSLPASSSSSSSSASSLAALWKGTGE